jgi:pimeloyl-ACP methyl ester carboxylesterase
VRNVRALEPALRGPGWADLWVGFRASMHMELLPPEARDLLRAGDDARQDMLLGYWAEVFELEPERIEAMLDEVLEAVRRSGVPVAVLYGHPLGEDRAWVQERLPGAELVVWPVGNHFPHLAHPERFGGLLRLMAHRAPVPIPVQAAV